MSEWRTIDTAPQDKTEVIVFAPHEAIKVLTAQFIFDKWCYSSAGMYAPRDDFVGDEPICATHWMPLPDPPHTEG